jgi:hypothetical protein
MAVTARGVLVAAALGLLAFVAVLIIAPRSTRATSCSDPLAFLPIPDVRLHRDFQFVYTAQLNRQCGGEHFSVVDAPPQPEFTLFAGGLITWTPSTLGARVIRLHVDEIGPTGNIIGSADTSFNAYVDDNTMTYPLFRDYINTDTVAIQGRTNGDAQSDFLSYTLDYAVMPTELSSPTNWVPIAGPITTPVTSTGTLATWDISDHSALPDGTRLMLRLTANLRDRSTGTTFASILDDRVIIDRTAKPAWPKRLGGPITQSPVVADLNDDGSKEIVVTTLQPAMLYVYRADGSLLWSYDPGLATQSYAGASVGDVDGDGRPDVVWPTQGRLHALNGATGQLLPGFPALVPGSSFDLRAPPTLADVTGDGKLDIILIGQTFTTADAPPVFVYSYQNGPMLAPGWPQFLDAGDFGLNAPASVADLDGVAGLDIVVSGADKVYAWHGDGTPVAGLHRAALAAPILNCLTHGGGGSRGTSQPVIADIDGDGVLEIIVGSNVLTATGQPKAGWVGGRPTATNAAAAAVGDLDGNTADGLEISVGNSMYHADGTPVPGWPVARVMSGTVLADLGGGDIGVLGGTREDNFTPGILGFDADGALESGYVKALYGETWDTIAPVVGDVDGDGRVDVVVAVTDVSYGGILDLYKGEGPYYAERAFWPMRGKDVQRTGYNAPTAPNRPTVVTKRLFNNDLVLTWNDNSLVESGFVVERSADGSPFSYQSVAEVGPDTTMLVAGLASTADLTAFYRVRARLLDPHTGRYVVSDPSPATTVVSGGSVSGIFQLLTDDVLVDPIRTAVTRSGGEIDVEAMGATDVEASLLGSLQGIAPMSRNLLASTVSQHPSWAPSAANIVGLDAVLLLKHHADTGCASDPESSQHWLRLILAGADGSGSRAACSHQARLDAIAALGNCLGNNDIARFYRPDDASGTTDFLRSRLGISGFCNDDGGQQQSRGPHNTDNADADPVRVRCVSIPGFAATPCRSDGTAGLVTALSEPEPGLSNVDVSIAARVGADGSRATVGYTSRRGLTLAVRAINIDTRLPSALSVRSGLYPLARPLFIHSADLTQPSITIADPTGEQQKLLAWTTGIGADEIKNPGCFNANGTMICGRRNMDSIVRQAGFITCTDDPSTAPPANNLCFAPPPPYSPPAPGPRCGAPSASCSSGSACCSGTCAGSACLACRQPGFGCTDASECCSGSCAFDPLSVIVSGICD